MQELKVNGTPEGNDEPAAPTDEAVGVAEGNPSGAKKKKKKKKKKASEAAGGEGTSATVDGEWIKNEVQLRGST